jgi:hypothetical protein
MCLFPCVLLSLLFCLISAFSISLFFHFLLHLIQNDGISTALRTRWHRMLPLVWINIGRGMKSVFYCILYCKGGETSRILEYKIHYLDFRSLFVTFTGPRSAGWRIIAQSSGRTVWVNMTIYQFPLRTGKYCHAAIPRSMNLFSLDSLPLNYGVVNNGHVLLINLSWTLILAFVQLFIVI